MPARARMTTHGWLRFAATFAFFSATALAFPGCAEIEPAQGQEQAKEQEKAPAAQRPPLDAPTRQQITTKRRPGQVRRPRATVDLIDALRRPPAREPSFEVAVYRSPAGVVVLPYVDVKGLAVAEGDIILGPIADVRGRQAMLRASFDNAAFALASPGTPELGRRWPDGVIHFKKHPDLADDRTAAIDFAIGEYERLTPLRFVEGEGNGNFVEFVNQLPFLSSMSALGMRGGRQELKISTNPDHTSTSLNRSVLHELGHTIGFKHEHSRPDRDDFVQIGFCPLDIVNVIYHVSGNYGIASDYDSIGRYDFDSVMHYPSNEGCSTGQGCCNIVKLPQWRAEGDELGLIPLNTRLSRRDVNAIYLMYSESPARNESGDWYGLTVLVHDFDGDEIGDLAVGAPREDTGGNRRGAVYLYKGTATGLVYWKRFVPPPPEGNNSNFGAALAAGDFNDDDTQDLAIGAPRAATGDQNATGTVYVYSVLANAEHELLATLHKDDGPDGSREAYDQFGASLAALRGPSELLLAIGAPGGRSGLRRTGAVYIARVDDDPDLLRVSTQGHYIANFRSFGYALAAARLPGANEDLLFVSAPTITMDDDLSRGSPSVFIVGRRQSDGAYVIGERLVSPDVEPLPDGTLIAEPGVVLDAWASVVEPDFGRALAAGDFDDDGRLDLAVGSTMSGGAGRVFLYERDGITWVQRQALDQGGLDTNEDLDSFGAALAAHDLDGDGRDDLVVGAYTENQGDVWNGGAVYVFRGASGAVLVEPWRALHPTVESFGGFEDCFAHAESDWFGRAVTIGDINGDGAPDVVAGGPQRAPCRPVINGFGFELVNDQPSGEVYIYRGTGESGDDAIGGMTIVNQETQSPHLD